MTEFSDLPIDVQKLNMYQERADLWVRDKINIELARYRDRKEIDEFLASQSEDRHVWLRKQLAMGKLTFDSNKSYQADALREMSKPQYIALPWSNGAAKTATAALIVLWMLDCFPDSICLTTAGTWSQLKEQLWREIARWGSMLKDGQEITVSRIDKTQIDIGPGWAAFGRAADRPETFEGVHAENLMVLVDEAKAVQPDIFDSIRRIGRGNEKRDEDGNLKNRFWCIFLSSPGSPIGPFYDAVMGDQAHRYKTLHVSAYESTRISLEQIDNDLDDLGEDSPLFISMDLGQFPPESEFTIIPLTWIEAAVDRHVTPPKGESPSELNHTLGVDVARFGGDNSAIIGLYGRKFVIEHEYGGRDLVFTANKVNELFKEKLYTRIAVDDTGLGGGVTDMLRSWNRPVKPINFAQTKGIVKPERFARFKAEMYWYLREAFKETYENYDDPTKGISIPKNKKLIHQLNVQEYTYTMKQQMVMKSHDQLRKDKIKSPDLADALALAYAAKYHPHCSGMGTNNVLDINERATVSRRRGQDNILKTQF
jgi:phage terminase large subunit